MEQEKVYPLDITISFHKIIERYKEKLEVESSSISREYIENMLDYIGSFPKLTEGLESAKELNKYRDPIKILLRDLFPEILSKNEIKAISIPFHDFVFNSTEKFRNILEKAGKDFELSISNLNEDLDYIYACIKILNLYYGYNLDFSRFLYYDIPDDKGIKRHYRIDLDWEFMDIFPKEGFKDVTDEEVDLLVQNIEDIELWKKSFPPKSWVFKGFTIITLTDVTVDEAISDLKSTLLQRNASREEELKKYEDIFRSIYKIPDLRVGYAIYNEHESNYEHLGGKCVSGFILDAQNEEECKKGLCEESFKALMRDHTYFAVSNVDAYAKKNSGNLLAENLLELEAKSAILAPIVKNRELLGVLELISFHKNELNSVNAKKLDDILPYIVTAVDRNKTEFENRVKAVIQNECTSIHPSVLWIFEKEARQYIKGIDEDGLASFQDIAFENIYPLYGQIDIVASSEVRNEAIQKDFQYQLTLLNEIVDLAIQHQALPIYEQVKFRMAEFQKDLEENLSASSEQKVFNLLQKEINPLLEHLQKQTRQLKKKINEYREKLDPKTGIIYDHRKNYDEAVQRTNRVMARYIDRKQVEAQKAFPHYFERYKTDGVEHSIYIGASLVDKNQKSFDDVYLYNMRLWQLSTMCEMENRFYEVQENMPIALDAASLILVFNSTISIRYRMDEKKFDVDGAYNARYEIIKKRIDKACVKNTNERITQKGKLAIIYSQRSDEREYLMYVKYLQLKKYLGEKVELLELEDVQGVIGLKAIRVEVLYQSNSEADQDKVITYEDLMKELH